MQAQCTSTTAGSTSPTGGGSALSTCGSVAKLELLNGATFTGQAVLVAHPTPECARGKPG